LECFIDPPIDLNAASKDVRPHGVRL
jgi:hypothetical protein